MESRNVQVLNIEKMSHNEAMYSSYKINISISNIDNVFHQSFWPAGVKCQWWYPPRAQNPDSDNNYNDNYNGRHNDNNDNSYNSNYYRDWY